MAKYGAPNFFNTRLAGMSEEACDAEFQAVLQKLTVHVAKMQALHAPPDPVKAMQESIGLVERMLKIQILMRRAYPKRSRPARRLRRRNAHQ